MSAGDCLITIDGVVGEADDSEFPNSIEVLEWKWGTEMSDSTGLAQASTNARADMKLFVFDHYIDSASPNLMMACIKNRIIKTAHLVMRRAGGGAKGEKFVIIDFKKVRVASTELMHREGQLKPIERVSLAYEEVLYDYVEQGRRGLKQGGNKNFEWRLHG